MKTTILIENSSEDENLTAEHGLSVLIETEKNNILVDTGQTDAFLSNAEKLGIDLKKVDKVFLSHGHYDHCGGVLAFSEINPDADVYINGNAFAGYYDIEGKYIGIDERIKDIGNLHVIDNCSADDGISVFNDVYEKELFPFGNARLFRKDSNGNTFPDDFIHEQYVVAEENGKLVLVSGCAHRGIVNIIKRFVLLYGREPDAVISGFHLMKKTAYTEEESALIRETANALLAYDTTFYTGHCTGDALPVLREIMGNKLVPIHTGMKLEI